MLSKVVGCVDQHRLLPNVFAEGFLFGQLKAVNRLAFLMGKISVGGFWYFFPVAFAVKTPIAILLLLVGGVGALIGLARRGCDNFLTAAFVLLPIVVLLGAAMTTHINIGLRHILPIYPLVLLICAAAVVRAFAHSQTVGRVVAAVAIVATTAEVARAYPDTLTFFNAFAGGPEGGSRFLVDSSIDWGQDLKPLGEWMTAHNVAHINLAYFGTANPASYGINASELPGSTFSFGASTDVALPGYVAISATVQRGVYLPEASRRIYASFDSRTPVAYAGHSIAIYWVDKPWW